MRYVWVLSVLLIGAWLPALAQECPDGYRKTGEQVEQTADATIIHPVCERIKTDKSAAVKARYCKAKAYIAKDQEGLRALNFSADVEQFERFEEVSTEQKAELQKKAVDALLDQGLEVAEKGVEAAKSLNPWSVNKAITQLKAKGFSNERVLSAMRRVAATKNKPEMAEAYKLFVKEAQAAKEGWDTGKDMAMERDTAGLRLLLGALKVMQNNPELGLAVTSVEFGENLAYLYYLNGAIAEQGALTDQKLATLARLSAQIKSHVGDLKKAKADWAKTGKSGVPDCSS